MFTTGRIIRLSAVVVGVNKAMGNLHLADGKFTAWTVLLRPARELIPALATNHLVFFFRCDGTAAAAAANESGEGEDLPVLGHLLRP